MNRNNLSLNIPLYMEKIEVKIKNQNKLITNKNNEPSIYQIYNYIGKDSRSIDHCSLSVYSHFWGYRSKSLQKKSLSFTKSKESSLAVGTPHVLVQKSFCFQGEEMRCIYLSVLGK